MQKAIEICPTRTKHAIEKGALLVDVREKEEVDTLAFDVPNIINIPLSEFEERYAELPQDRDLVMLCRVGERSLKTTYFLMNNGYTRVANMSGGIEKWVKKGFPTKGDISSITQVEYSCCGTSAKSIKKDDHACCGADSNENKHNKNSCC